MTEHYTTAEVRNVFAYIGQGFAPSKRKSRAEAEANFDSWLAEHDREVLRAALTTSDNGMTVDNDPALQSPEDKALIALLQDASLMNCDTCGHYRREHATDEWCMSASCACEGFVA